MARHDPPVFESPYAIYMAESNEPIGEGGAGRVYRCLDEDGRAWAVKTLDSGQASRDKLKRFKNEQYFCARQPHKNIVTVVDDGLVQANGRRIPFLVMPLYDDSLRRLMRQRIAPDQVLPLFSQILDGVEAAHFLGVVHRDLKPENVLYRGQGDLIQLVVADFGIAHFAADLQATQVETAPGTRLANFQYAAPEQRARGARIDQRADIYALGLIHNEMFTGELALGTGYRTIALVSPPHAYLDDLVEQMLKQSPEHRPSSIAEIKATLIGRRNQFVERQRLDALKQTVIPAREVSDPLIDDPVRLTGVDWDGNNLILGLSQPVNPAWIDALHHMGSYQSMMGADPERFAFHGSTARVSVRAETAQRVIDLFKEWLPRANAVYAQRTRQAAERAEEEERKQLQAQIAAAEARAHVRQSLHI